MMGHGYLKSMHHILPQLAGGLLLISAGLKAQDGFYPALPLLANWQIAFWVFEILLGFWLISRWQTVGSCFTGAGVYAVLAAVNVYLLVQGAPSCGCFGKTQVSPWVMLAVDCLLALGLGFIGFSLRKIESSAEVKSTIAILLGMGIIASTSQMTANSSMFQERLAKLRGSALFFDPVVKLPAITAGTQHTFALPLKNITEQPITISGATSDCSCIATEDLPFDLSPGESKLIRVTINAPVNLGVFERKIEIRGGYSYLKTYRVRISGEVFLPTKEEK
jgi:hypothetical protein